MTNNARIAVRIPTEELNQIDWLVDNDDYSSRSNAVRYAIRDLLYARLPGAIERHAVKFKKEFPEYFK